MENKIRVWDNEISDCDDCYCQNTEFGVCQLNYAINNIKNCPFSKPLTSEDIERYRHENANDFHTMFKLRDANINELCFQTYWIEEQEWLDEEYIYYDIKCNTFKITHKSKTLFFGTINNLPEFKLLLKQLNIE